jgi:hypothetical protein
MSKNKVIHGFFCQRCRKEVQSNVLQEHMNECKGMKKKYGGLVDNFIKLNCDSLEDA